jgi:hypothetical protein
MADSNPRVTVEGGGLARHAARMNGIAEQLERLVGDATELGEPALARLIAGALREARHQPSPPRPTATKRETPQFA